MTGEMKDDVYTSQSIMQLRRDRNIAENNVDVAQPRMNDAGRTSCHCDDARAPSDEPANQAPSEKTRSARYKDGSVLECRVFRKHNDFIGRSLSKG